MYDPPVGEVAEYYVRIPPSVSNTKDTKFMICYGESPPVPDERVTRVFHDDFSSWSGWNQYGSGTVSQSAEQSRGRRLCTEEDGQ